MSEDYDREGWRPSWKASLPLGTAHLATLPDRDDLARREDPSRLVFGPVETENGEAMRLMALGVLGDRNRALEERRQRQRLTSVETRELMDNESAIHTLKRMAPVGELLPARGMELV